MSRYRELQDQLAQAQARVSYLKGLLADTPKPPPVDSEAHALARREVISLLETAGRPMKAREILRVSIHDKDLREAVHVLCHRGTISMAALNRALGDMAVRGELHRDGHHWWIEAGATKEELLRRAMEEIMSEVSDERRQVVFGADSLLNRPWAAREIAKAFNGKAPSQVALTQALKKLAQAEPRLLVSGQDAFGRQVFVWLIEDHK